MGYEIAGVVVWNPEDVGLAVAWNHILDVLWVKVSEFIDGDSDKLADLLEMQVLVNLECVQLGRHPHVCRSKSVLLAVMDGVHRPDERRDIPSGLTWKVVIDRPKIPFAPVPANGLVDVARSAVVGRDRKVPVSEYVVGVGQVTRGGIG